MTKQITVRLPDELVAFIDELVGTGRFESRAAIITREVRRLQRRLIAEKDVEIYRREGEDPELVAIVKHMSGRHPALED